MAPIRRYLRITRFSVLEVRIYLEDPSLGNTWLLSPRSPALPRIIAAIRPLVLPKLREENENAAKKGAKKKKATKDTVSEQDFEVSIFLTPAAGSHALMTKSKAFVDKGRLRGGAKMGLGGGQEDPVVLREEEDDDALGVEGVPFAHAEDGVVRVESDEEEESAPAGRKRKRGADERGDDKKKLGLRTAYEGFSIYGRILCLVVKRKGVKARAEAPAGSSQMLENWMSTQLDRDRTLADEDG